MIEIIIMLFIGSLIAWIGGDNSMAWFVILILGILVFGSLFSSCS